MATISTDDAGRRKVQFVGPDGLKKTVRLGTCALSHAQTIKLRIELLLSARIHNAPIDPQTAAWLADLPAKGYDRIAATGLVESRERQRVTLGKMLKAFMDAADVKPTTRVRVEQAKASLLNTFAEDRMPGSITEAEADAWRAGLKAEGYAPATVSRTVLYVKQMFRWAVRRGLAPGNPFSELKAGAQTNAARQVFIDRATIAKVIDAAPDAEWRLLIVLSRFGGLRVPSEALALRWTDVDWGGNRITVRASKTEHHEGQGIRVIPMFPELREHLMQVFEEAPDGAELVITRYTGGANLNPQLHRIIKRAGLKPWHKVWHNLRASRQTELATMYPLHTVCSWIGNTKAIAAGHYLTNTDADFLRAVGQSESDAKSDAKVTQKATPHVPAPTGADRRESPEVTTNSGIVPVGADGLRREQQSEVGTPGLEPGTHGFSIHCSTN